MNWSSKQLLHLLALLALAGDCNVGAARGRKPKLSADFERGWFFWWAGGSQFGFPGLPRSTIARFVLIVRPSTLLF